MSKITSSAGYSKQEILQAIIFADEFMHDLKPVQEIYPTTLLPVVTCPLLHYLLETVVRSGVQQVFLYCSSHIGKLKEFIHSLEHFQENNVILTPLFSDGCRSLGDALRDIYNKGCIRGDFILIRGTAFANIHLGVFMNLHKARKEKDKNTALTMIFRNLGSTRDSALKNESSLVVSNTNTRRLLYYKRFDPGEKKVELARKWFLINDKISIDTALFDTRIYLCSQSALSLFADNFDFQVKIIFKYLLLIYQQ